MSSSNGSSSVCDEDEQSEEEDEFEINTAEGEIVEQKDPEEQKSEQTSIAATEEDPAAVEENKANDVDGLAEVIFNAQTSKLIGQLAMLKEALLR